MSASSARFVTQDLAGWGNYPRQECKVLRPERQRELEALVADTSLPSLISRGLGRSYGDAALNEGAGVVLHTRLDRMLAFDEEQGVLDCEAGVTFEDILTTFVPRGWFPSVTPGTRFITVGGALAADVHGKNHHREGCVGAFVHDLDLLTASGEIVRCSREENPELFDATLGGLGLTGIIVRARLQLRRIETAWIQVDYEKTSDLDRTLERFTEDDEKYRYSVAWIDCLSSGRRLGRSVLMRGNHAAPGDLPAARQGQPLVAKAKRRKTIPFNFPSFALNSLSVKAFNTVFYGRHPVGRRLVSYESFFYPLDAVEHWNRMYGRRGFVQYQAVFPPASSRQGLIELLERFSRSRRPSFLAVLKTFGPEAPGPLSFPQPGHTIALDLPLSGSDLVPFLQEMDQVVLAYGGRIYAAKDAWTTAESFATMYPRLDEFRALKRRVDPAGRFSSSLARRVGMMETP